MLTISEKIIFLVNQKILPKNRTKNKTNDNIKKSGF